VIAEDLGAKSFRALAKPHEFTTHVLSHSSTFFEFYFGAEGLRAVIVAMGFTTLATATAPRGRRGGGGGGGGATPPG
jgi:hypothetical protein